MNSVRPERALARRAVASMVALSTGAVLALSTAGPALAVEGEAPQERVLQSVDVQVAPDGTLTNVDGTVVQSTSEDAGDADSSESEYAPDEVATELPLRVMTAWRTEDGVGTDLADLDGYDGEIRIDVTVQNLTVKPQTLTYDVAAESREQAALVGSPLTVVAAADLGDLASDSVVTAGQTPDTDVTNGVLGKGQDGETQVQWATILAPPQLGASARFSLVVDAKDFEVPDLDISVQPGLVTDPSLGALVDSAFDPQGSQETQLQQDTISLISDVNGVLARAGATISDVRQILSGSAETLGDKTVADLQSSTESIAGSVEGLNSTLRGLQQQVSSSLEQTGSSSLAELETAVTTVDAILGDTDQRAPSIAVDDRGCQSVVARPGQQDSVFGNLLVVASQLSAYADATGNCKEALRQTIIETLGPQQPDAQSCPEVRETTTAVEDNPETDVDESGDSTTYTRGDSVTCSFYSADLTYGAIAQELRTATDEALALLDPDLYKEALGAAGRVTTLTKDVSDITKQLNTGRLFVAEVLRQAELYTRDYDPNDPDQSPNAGAMDRQIGLVRESLAVVHTDATAALNALDGSREQVQTTISNLCGLRDQLGEEITPQQQAAFDSVLGRLQKTQCDGETPLQGADETPLEDRFLADPVEKLRDIVEATNPEGGQGGAGAALAEIDRLRTYLHGEVEEARAYPNPTTGESLAQLQARLERALYGFIGEEGPQKGLLGEGGFENEDNGELAAFEAAVGELEDKSEDLPNIKRQIYTAIENAEDRLGKSVEEGIEQVNKSRKGSTDQLDSMFENSTQGMREAADQVVNNGRDALGSQKAEFTRAQQEASRRIAAEIGQGLASINEGVSASTRQMDAAGTLLTADLRKVLLDLGEREVNGGGLLGAMTTSAQTAKSADVQLANATRQTTAYSNVRSSDVAGILLRQAQAKAAMQMLADMPAFELDLSAGTLHRTVYNYRIGDGQ